MRNICLHPVFISVIAWSKGALLTLPRVEPPWEGFLQLPEGPLKRGELPENASVRILKDASGLTGTKMKRIGVHDSLERVEKRRALVLSFLAMNWIGEIPLEGVRWLSDWRGTELAFEHSIMCLEADSVMETALRARTLYAVR